VNVNAVSNQPPTISFLSPTNGQNFFRPVPILLNVAANDNDGFIRLVEFFEGTNLLAMLTNPPFSFIWSNVADNWTGTNLTVPITITVSNAPPTIAITNPLNGANIFEGTNLVINATAFDPDGSIALVEFFESTNKIGELTNAPFTLIWSNIPFGEFTLIVKATDDFGDTTISSNVNIIAVSNQPPNISFLSPTNGQNFFRPANILLSAQASDSDGTIRLVEFFEGTNLLTQLTNPPFSFVWNNVAVGTHSLTARAFDNWKGTNVTGPVLISVGNTPPQIALVNPTNSEVFFEGTNITFQANASDIDGSITLVEFFESTNKIGKLTNAPFTVVWSNVALGNFVLSVKATDDYGDSTISSNVNISVISNQPPTISFLSPTNGQTFFRPANILLNAEASDSDGFVRLVEFFEGTNRVAQLTNLPFSFVWSNVAVGTYSLTAQAADNWLGTNRTAPILVSVIKPPPLAVTLLNPVIAENKFSFRFMSESDFIYTIQFSDSFSPMQWQALTNFAGNGAQIIFSENHTNAHRFYRVLAQ